MMSEESINSPQTDSHETSSETKNVTANNPQDSSELSPAQVSDEKKALPGLRIQIGSLAKKTNESARPKPQVLQVGKDVEVLEKPKKTFPPPNLSKQLTPELEKELEEALGGMSLDDALKAQDEKSATGEVALEEKTHARVVSIHRDDVFFEIGSRNQGVLSLKQFAEPPQIGAVVEVFVSRLNAEDGLYELTLPGAAVEVGDWSEVAEGMVVEAAITSHNKGGLECEVSKLRGFIPASQIAPYRVENLEQFVGQRFSCLITEANPEKRNLVLSRRALIEREQESSKQQLLSQLEVGQEREGVVRSLQDFGAFVDLGGGIDGLIHISQLSWDRVKHAKDVLKEGQTVKVRIQKIDASSGRIGLAYRDLTDNPWTQAAQKYSAKTNVQGTVTKIMDFGAFVQLEPGVEGLVHISELAHGRVWRAADIVQEGQEVDVQILSIDPDAQRMSLSMKALQARPVKPGDSAKKKGLQQEVPEDKKLRAKGKSTANLKGGVGGGSGGEQFGLKW